MVERSTVCFYACTLYISPFGKLSILSLQYMYMYVHVYYTIDSELNSVVYVLLKVCWFDWLVVPLSLVTSFKLVSISVL